MRSPRRSSKSTLRWNVRVNYRFALTLLFVVVALVGLGWFLRRQSMSRNATELLQFAKSQQAAGETKRALESLRWYLGLVPNDPEGIKLFAELTDGRRMSPDDFLATYQLISVFVLRNPDSIELRERLFQMSYELQRYGELVDTHLPRMRERVLENRDYVTMAVDAYQSLSRFEEGLQLLLASVDSQPEMVSRYGDLIDFLTSHEFNAVDLAGVARRFATGPSTEAESKAENEGREPGDPLIDARLRNLATGDDSTETRPEENGGEPSNPDEPELRVADGVVEELQDSPETTLSVPILVDRILDEALRKGRPPVEARVLRARIQLGLDNLEKASVELDEAQKVDPQDSDYLSVRLEALSRLREIAQLAEDSGLAEKYSRAILELEKSADGSRRGAWMFHLLLGKFLMEAGDLPKSEAQYRRSLELWELEKQQRPDSVVGRTEAVKNDFLTQWGLVNTLIETVYRRSPQTPDEEDEFKRHRGEINDLIGSIRKMAIVPQLIEFLDVRSLLVERKWNEAAERFEAIRAGLSDLPDIVRNIDRSLVECYQRLGNPDEAIRALRRTVTSDPGWVEGRMMLADAYVRIGREDLALDEFSQVAMISSIPSVVIRIAIRREMERPESARDWSSIENILDAERAKNPQNADLLSIQSDVLRLRNRSAEGLKLVQAARQANPEDDSLVAVEVAQLLLDDSTERSVNIARAQELLQSIGRDSAVLRLAQARVEASRGGEQLGTRLLELSENVSSWTVAQRTQLYEELARIAAINNYPEAALKLFEANLELQPDNMDLLLGRAILLMQTGASADAIQAAVARVEELDAQPRPVYHYLVGLRDLRDYRALGEAAAENIRLARLRLLRSAEQSLAIASKARPSWVDARNQYAVALYELGDEEAAYRISSELLSQGTPTPEAVANTVQYLLKNQRDDELLEVVKSLEQSQPLLISEDVMRAGMLASYRSRRWDETLQRLGRLGSSTVEDLLIQAQLLIARRGDSQQIEEVLTQALSLAPEQRMAWFLWVSFLIREQRMDEANGVRARIETEVPHQPSHLRPWTLAQCEELLGDLDQADQHYSEAHRDNVADLQIMNEHIGFLVRHNRLPKAQALLRLLSDPASGLDDEVRNQAEILNAKLRGVSAQSYNEFEAALAALQADSDLTRVSAEKLRAQVELYAVSGRSREQRKMIAILEELGARKLLTTQESMELAWLYARNWRWSDSVVMYRRLFEREPDNLAAHASFVDMALRRPQLDERTVQDVSKSVSQLSLRDPQSLRTLIAQVRWLHFEGKTGDTEFLIRQFLENAKRARPIELFREVLDSDRAPMVLAALRRAVTDANDLTAQAVVNALENNSLTGDDPQLKFQLGKYIESPKVVEMLREQIWHRAASLAELTEQFELANELFVKSRDDDKSVEATLEYLSFLSRRSRFDAAIERWKRIRGEFPPGFQARCLAAIVRAGNAPAEVCGKVESLMREILAAVPEESAEERVRVLLSLADVYDFQERFAEARAIYATILDADPRNVVGLNNLAILNSYAERPDERERGAGLIDQAIEIVGPLPTLLDSRAIVKLNLDQLDSALDDLRQALDQDSNPTYWLHLAYIQLRKNDLRGASESFEKASVSQVDAARIHPLERPFFDELRRRLAPPGT